MTVGDKPRRYRQIILPSRAHFFSARQSLALTNQRKANFIGRSAIPIFLYR